MCLYRRETIEAAKKLLQESDMKPATFLFTVRNIPSEYHINTEIVINVLPINIAETQ